MRAPDGENAVERLHERRHGRSWRAALVRLLTPPQPVFANPREPGSFPLGRWNLYIGGAGTHVDGYINLDLFPLAGVDVAADAHWLPFVDGVFTRVECDAVLEHVADPSRVVREIERVLAPGGHVHLVVPFCHPFHEYPKDFRRFTPDGLRQLAGELQVVAEGWRTGPTATLLAFLIEYSKMWFPWKWWRVAVHGVLGWLLFPLRYLDWFLLRNPRAGVLGNHAYIWLRKR